MLLDFFVKGTGTTSIGDKIQFFGIIGLVRPTLYVSKGAPDIQSCYGLDQPSVLRV